MPDNNEARDRYYQKKYGVGLDWYNARLSQQGRCCGICKRPQELFTKRFAIDHDHSWKRVRVESGRNLSASENSRGWFARAFYNGNYYRSDRLKKAEAIRDVKKRLKTGSCRGLLCPFCNRGLRYYADDPNRLANAAEYLKRYQRGYQI